MSRRGQKSLEFVNVMTQKITSLPGQIGKRNQSQVQKTSLQIAANK
jgi:hypothetical protein